MVDGFVDLGMLVVGGYVGLVGCYVLYDVLIGVGVEWLVDVIIL